MPFKTRHLALVLCLTPFFNLASASPSHSADTDQALIRTLDHIALNVRDLTGSLNFYTKVLGLEEIPAAAAGRKWLKISGNLQLHLLGDRQLEVINNKNVHIALRCSNLDELIKRLDAHKISWGNFKGDLRAISTSRSDGVRQIFFQDPDGYWIEVNDAKD